MTTALLPVEFTAPLIAPESPHGLTAATTWTEDMSGEALRWLPSGVQFRLRTHRPSTAFGIWGAPWCVDPDELDPEDDLKTGPAVEDTDPDPFEAMTVWAADRLQECGNLSEFDRSQVIERARHTFAVSEPIAVETQFATRARADAPTPENVDDLLGAVSHLEQTLAATGTTDARIHARAGLLAVAENLRLLVRDRGGALRTPAGHRWCFSGGYATPLGDTLIATTATYGWRGEIEVREAIDYERNQFVAIAERSIVVGYEAVLGAAEITT